MAKDPAVLFYIDKWLAATKGMKADAKGWYLNLILFHFKYGDLPNDLEELANLCDVRISEYEKFKQVFEQVLKQKFEVNSEQRLENETAREIIQKRKTFLEKRSNSGRISYLIKFIRKHYKFPEKQIDFLKEEIDLTNIDLKDEQVLKQVIEQKSELYINVNANVNTNINEDKKNKYGSQKNVLLKDSEHEKLKEKFGNSFEKILNNFSDGIAIKNYGYKNHYLAILKWNKDFKENSDIGIDYDK